MDKRIYAHGLDSNKVPSITVSTALPQRHPVQTRPKIPVAELILDSHCWYTPCARPYTDRIYTDSSFPLSLYSPRLSQD